ncbi:MAG TPA: hypothetical protein VE866_12350 [Candidatus Binatia bacterium]|nr:hypothetical protein [Candidatus Binatia bacterium]
MPPPLSMAALHFIPLLLLIGIQQPTDLVIRGLMDFHHLRAPVILESGSVAMQTLYLRL